MKKIPVIGTGGTIASGPTQNGSALAKLMWVLGQSGDFETARKLFYQPVHHDILCREAVPGRELYEV